jgi:hypothetical protein
MTIHLWIAMVIAALRGMMPMKFQDHLVALVSMILRILLHLYNAVLVVVDLPMVGQLIHLLMILQAMNIHLKNLLKLNLII